VSVKEAEKMMRAAMSAEGRVEAADVKAVTRLAVQWWG